MICVRVSLSSLVRPGNLCEPASIRSSSNNGDLKTVVETVSHRYHAVQRTTDIDTGKRRKDRGQTFVVLCMPHVCQAAQATEEQYPTTVKPRLPSRRELCKTHLLSKLPIQPLIVRLQQGYGFKVARVCNDVGVLT